MSSSQQSTTPQPPSSVKRITLSKSKGTNNSTTTAGGGPPSSTDTTNSSSAKRITLTKSKATNNPTATAGGGPPSSTATGGKRITLTKPKAAPTAGGGPSSSTVTTSTSSGAKPTSTSSNNNNNNNNNNDAATVSFDDIIGGSAEAHNIRVWHQRSTLSLLFYNHDGRDNNVNDNSSASPCLWRCRGETTMYVVNEEEESSKAGITSSKNNTSNIALNLRGNCRVIDIKGETINTTYKKQQRRNSTNTDGSKSNNTEEEARKMIPLTIKYEHTDPLAHVLTKPLQTYTEQDFNDEITGNPSKRRYDADSQCSRGGIGMTTGLRAASVASNMGELRMAVSPLPPAEKATKTENEESLSKDEIYQIWKDDLSKSYDTYSSDSDSSRNDGNVVRRLRAQLYQRSNERRKARINLLANRLADATLSPSAPSKTPSYSKKIKAATSAGETNNDKSKEVSNSMSKVTINRAMKITIQYEISVDSLSQLSHMGGIHFHGTESNTGGLNPYMYTTCGIMGDHEGPRCWIPCLDSGSYRHRASHELTIKISAPMKNGLSIVGCGEDFGVTQTLLHDINVPLYNKTTQDELGQSHSYFVSQYAASFNNTDMSSSGRSAETTEPPPHLIPPESDESSAISTIDSIMATCIWSTAIWTPIPARSLGFAIGPFKPLFDPEYYNDEDDDDDADDNDDVDGASDAGGIMEDGRSQTSSSGKRKKKKKRRLRKIDLKWANGEGIRQMYFAPLYERKHIHATAANMTLLPNTDIVLGPLSQCQLDECNTLDETIQSATTGVPNRSLSLMRDILALPIYRTSSYTQIWIPNAAHGGSTSGSLQCCPDVIVNCFLGGSIIDSKLLPPVGQRLPYYSGGGRTLQFVQARGAVRGWIIAALPMGGQDDVGFGYIPALIESFIMSLYERAHGAYGEGGGPGSVFFNKRHAIESGLNSKNLDFLPVTNIEEEEHYVPVGSVVGAVPIEERNNDQLWRSASNGSESHTSATDEFAVRQVLVKDVVDALERGTDKDKGAPLPSMGWMGSYLSLSFLSSNSTSSSLVGCGALELCHPTGGTVYRALKCELLRRILEGRAGVSNVIRVIRAAFIAAHLGDRGETELKVPEQGKEKHRKEGHMAKLSSSEEKVKHDHYVKPRPPFHLCVEELLKKNGLTHTLFIKALRILSGPIREPHLRGSLVDVQRDNRDTRTNRQFIEPENFPNSFVRGSSELYLRVGAHVEPAGTDSGGTSSQSAASAVKGIQLHLFSEPVIPEGGIAYGGPVTVRVVENEGNLREFVRNMKSDGSRCEWGPIYLHSKPVTTARQQTAASGAIEGGASKASSGTESGTSSSKRLLGSTSANRAFNDAILHNAGYQAIELVRLTNRTPLLWVRIDPMGLYGGRISVSQPDACLSEQLFHDGDAGAQVAAIRALAERPLRIQGSVKVTTVYDVNVNELPIHILGDCLRGTSALVKALPHTPVVRTQAALAIAQWQNNKAPASKDAVGSDAWVGVNILIQYFKERHYSNGIVMPVKYTRLTLKKDEAEVRHHRHTEEGGTGANVPGTDDLYQYLDTIDDPLESAAAVERAEEIDIEEDEEYRVRSAVITAISSVRAKDGCTPPVVLRFLETILVSSDASAAGNVISPDEEDVLRKKRRQTEGSESDETGEFGFLSDIDARHVGKLPYNSSMLLADSLLALCNLNVRPAVFRDPATGKPLQSKAKHPVQSLMEACQQLLDWELYRENIKMESESKCLSGIGGGCDGPVAACAVTALFSLAILKEITTDDGTEPGTMSGKSSKKRSIEDSNKSKDAASAQFYMDIFDKGQYRAEATRAACAQALTCIYCAADRLETDGCESLGLLTAMEFMLDRILERSTSQGLKQTLALLMLDACTGKVCSRKRVGTIGGRGDLCASGAQFFGGPLGASHGGDNGSALLTSVSEGSLPVTSAVNDGARRGLRLLIRTGHPRDTTSRDKIVVRVAKFATKLWRTINGDYVPPRIDAGTNRASARPADLNGVCSFDGHLRCTLLSLWQWVYPNGCFAVMRVQTWRSQELYKRYLDIGVDQVMKVTDKEKEAAKAEEDSFSDLNQIVAFERDRHQWRGEMASKAYEYYKEDKKGTSVMKDMGEHGVGQPLPPVERDNAFKSGGWVAAAAQQRRKMTLDGGTSVSSVKLRLSVKSSSGGG